MLQTSQQAVTVFLIFLTGLTSNAERVQAQTYVSGTISSDETWSSSDGVYILEGRVWVAEGATLTVEPGTVIKGHFDQSGLYVRGTLEAAGTAEAPIVFTSFRDDAYGGDTNGDGAASQPEAGDWLGIGFFGSEGGTIRHGVVRYGGFNVSGASLVRIDDASPEITDSELGFSKTSAIYITGAGSTPRIERNQITNNGGSAIYVYDGGSAEVPTATITKNNITENTYGLRSISSTPIEARNNWWGDVSGPYHPDLNPDGQGNPVSGDVRFDPWLTSPVKIGGDRPDLVPASLFVGPASAPPGEFVAISFTARNEGAAPAAASTAEVRLSTSSATVSSTDPLLATISTPTLGADASVPLNESFRLPDDLADGTYHIWVILDADGQAGQQDRSNDKISVPVNVGTPVEERQPALSLSAASLKPGEAVAVTGSGFTPGAAVTLYVDGPGGFTTVTETRTASSSGEISYAFTTNSDSPPGRYVVSARDEVRGTSASAQYFRVTAPVPPANLVVVTPVEGETAMQGNRVTVEWLEDVRLGTPYPQEGARRGYRYRVEYTPDGGGTWTEVGTEEGFALIGTTASFSYSFIPAGIGDQYRVRITDLYRPERRAESGTFRIASSVADVRVDLVRDYSLDRRWLQTAGLQGVAADGVARLYLRLENRSTKTIQQVAVRLGDGVSSEASALGKVMQATVTNRYSDEANGATSTEADDDRSGLGTYWFWYVAPDDFARFAQGDRNRLARTVTAQFEVVFTDGTRQSVERDVRIVRPPLMLVHGLGGDERTWDRFGSGGKFFRNDERFLVRKTVNLEKAAAFQLNAFYLLGRPDQERFYRGSFLQLLTEMHRRGYAAAQVYYVSHSMGGSVLRTAQASSRFRAEANYEQGYVDRLITLGTPHLGSPLADITKQAVQAVNDFVLSGCSGLDFIVNYKECYTKLGIAGLREVVLHYQDAPAFLLSSFVRVEAVDGQTTFVPTPAIADLRAAGGVSFEETSFPSHLIAGDLVPGSQSLPGVPAEAWQAIGALKSLVEFWNKMLDQPAALSALGIDVASLEALSGLSDAERVVKALDLALRAYASTGFIADSDGVVSVESQLAGLGAGPRVSIVDRIIHTGPSWVPFADAVTASARVGSLVDDLLHAPVGSSVFGPIPASGGSGGGPLVAQAAPSQVGLKATSLSTQAGTSRAISETERPELSLLSPEPATEVVVGDPLLVRTALSDTTGLIYVKAYFQGTSLTSTEKEYVYDFTFEASGTAVDSQLVEVIAMYEKEGELSTVTMNLTDALR